MSLDPTSEPADALQGQCDEIRLAGRPEPEEELPSHLPESLVSHYRELLRAYVIMGSGNLTAEMTALGHLLSDAGVSAQRTMQLHIHVLEELIGGLGNRSARHVMNRADLLILEVMVHLADGYRHRYREQKNPWRQLALPGFDACLTRRDPSSE